MKTESPCYALIGKQSSAAAVGSTSGVVSVRGSSHRSHYNNNAILDLIRPKSATVAANKNGVIQCIVVHNAGGNTNNSNNKVSSVTGEVVRQDKDNDEWPGTAATVIIYSILGLGLALSIHVGTIYLFI